MANDTFDMIKNMDKKSLGEAVSQAKKFLATDEGKRAVEKIKNGQMPDGAQIPDNLKQAAKALSENPESAKKLAEMLGL